MLRLISYEVWLLSGCSFLFETVLKLVSDNVKVGIGQFLRLLLCSQMVEGCNCTIKLIPELLKPVLDGVMEIRV